MFSRFLSAIFIRQLLTTLVRIVFWPIRVAALHWEYYNTDDCRPLRSNEEILNFHNFPAKWANLVEPLLPRCKPRFLDEHFDDMQKTGHDNINIIEEERPKVMACHDLAGNYRGDRHITDGEKWDDYRFYHWGGIDYFCYFSHNYVTIPTLQWINAAHRNGVKVLGTFIVEGKSGRKILEDVLKSENQWKAIANSLSLIAKFCKFEGWFINIECDLNVDKIESLRAFLEYLTYRCHNDVPNGEVFWYDSIIKSGVLNWQNKLNEHNKLFFDACDGILLNYMWSEEDLLQSAKILNFDKRLMAKVFVGIDVFGRGQKAKFESHTTMAKIKKFNFSTGIFAPGWTFEAVTEYGVSIQMPKGNEICNQHFIERNERFWSLLWKYVFTFGPTQLPFHTSFCMGSGKRKYRDGLCMSTDTWFNLSDQAWQPSVPARTLFRDFDDCYTGGSSIRIMSANEEKRLFVCDFPCDMDIILAYAFKRKFSNELYIILIADDQKNQQKCKIICGGSSQYPGIKDKVRYCPPLKGQALENVLKHLSQRNEKTISPFSELTKWETRYYYLHFDKSVNPRITDIGVLTTIDNDNESSRGPLLGSLNLYCGAVSTSNLAGVCTITPDDFVSKNIASSYN